MPAYNRGDTPRDTFKTSPRVTPKRPKRPKPKPEPVQETRVPADGMEKVHALVREARARGFGDVRVQVIDEHTVLVRNA